MKLRSVKFEEVSQEMLVLMLQRVSSRVAGFLVPSRCQWGKLQNLALLKVSKEVVMSFRLAGVALCDIPTCFMTCQKWFCVASAILLQRFGKMRCIFRGRGSTLDTSDVILRGRRRTLDVSCSLCFANRIVRAASSGDTQHSTIHAPRFTPYTLHFTLRT